MKKSILFLPASIRSHIVPATYLADLLSETYDIHFAVTNEILGEIVTKQGYNVVYTGVYRVAQGMEQQYVFEHRKKVGKLYTLRSILNNDLFKFRQSELDDVIQRIKPVIVFVDIFNSTDILVLYSKHKHLQMAFLNPMLSTYKIDGYPTVGQGSWEDDSLSKTYKVIPKRISLKYLLTRPLDAIISKAMDRQFEKLTSINEFSKVHPIANDRTSALLFDNITEIILAPYELEVSTKIRKPNQYYLGLCVSKNRKDIEVDTSFEKRFDQIVARKNSSKQFIYCSFGTFYQGSDKALLNFLHKLLDAIEGLENVEALFSVNKLVIETLNHQRKIPEYIHMFSRVPQLKVLEHADLFVTHGGLGSVKEGIYFQVPMLVYPLDLNYDQNGNGFKVEYHGLGLRGIFKHERSEDMKRKMSEILVNKSFLKNIKEFRSNILKINVSESLNTILNQLLS